MKINDFFEKLEKEFGLTPYEYCKIKSISYSTLKKYLAGARPTPHVAKNIEKITQGKISLQDMGLKD